MGDILPILCILGIVIIAAVFILPRLMGGGGNQANREYPRYDDPNVQSRGGFGGTGTDAGVGNERPTYDSPDVQSRGGFGGLRGSGGSSSSSSKGSGGRSMFSGFSPTRAKPSGGSSGGGSRRADSPNVRSRGGFGKRK